MNDKQIYNLTKSDIEQYPIWYFPMDDSVEDELTVRPMLSDCQHNDYQVIVMTNFTGNDGKVHIGYIYWSMPNIVQHIKPVIFTSENSCITFWNGITQPSKSDYDVEQQLLLNSLPLKYSSVECQGLSSLSGILNGLYYIDGNGLKIV
jgi:hypothetical protein